MATRAVVLGQRPNRPSLLSVGLIGGGALIGLAATQDVMLALALILATGLVLLVASNIYALPIFLMCTMFVESLELGPGLRIGRVAGALALAALVYYTLAHGRVAIRASGLIVVSGAYGLWLLISLYWADEPSFVYTYLFSYVLAVAYLLAMAMLVRTVEHLRGIFMTLAFGSLVFGLIAFVSFARTGGTYAPEDLDDVRAAGLQGDPNYFAVYQTAALPAALVLAARERRPLYRLAYFGVVLMIVLSVASSLSRTGMMALVAVALGTLALPWRIFFRRAADKLTYAFTLVLAIGAAVVVGSTAFVGRVQSILDPSSSSDRGSGRTDLWAAAMNGYRDHPYLGLGAGNFRAQALDLLQTTPGVDTTRQYVLHAKAVHNAYLETLVDLGPVGLALFLGVLFLAGRTLVVASRRARAAGSLELERFSLAILLALIGFSVSAVFLSNQLGKLLWTLVGLAIAMDAITRRIPQRELVPARAEAPPASDYDLDVRERLVEQRERRAAEEFEAIRVERKRLAQLQATLEARVESPEPADLQQRAAAIEARAQAMVQRELAMAKAHAQLAARARELEAREQALEAEPPPAAPAPEPAPEPVVAAAPPPPLPAPVAEPVPEPEPGAVPEPAVAGAHNLVALERLVEEAAAAHSADRVEEWRYYLLYLRDHAAIDGSLPESFDFLVWDVFGELLGS